MVTLPKGQVVHSEEPGVDVNPVSQSRQMSSLVPVPGAYLPMAQSEQLADAAGAYRPAPQGWQSSAEPNSRTSSVASGQAVHSVEPGAE